VTVSPFTIRCPDFVVSDTHFGQHSILDLEHRHAWMGVANLVAMHEMMIAHWRATVGMSHTVLHLGDHITAPPHRQAAIADQLTGRIILVTGNHDMPTKGVMAEHPAVRFALPDGRIVLAVHDPAQAATYVSPSDALILHGHLHGKPPMRSLPAAIAIRCFDCSMDALRHPGPIALTDLIARICQRPLGSQP